MSVFIDGSTLSSLLYSHANSSGNQEGLLLGQVVNQVKEHISDSQINNTQVHTFIHVSCHIPWPSDDRVYTRGGVPIMEKMAAMVGNSHQQGEVVGWYSFRRNSTLRLSMKERTLHKHLEARYSGGKPQQFLCFLCVDTANSDCSTHCLDHFFATITQTSGAVHKLAVSVTNLGDTLHTQYKTLAKSGSTQSSTVKDILHQFQSQFVSAGEEMQEVGRISSMFQSLNTNLQRLCKQVAESEHMAGELEREVNQLKEQLTERKKQQEEKQLREQQIIIEDVQAVENSLDIVQQSLQDQGLASENNESALKGVITQERLVVDLGQGQGQDSLTSTTVVGPSVDDLLSMPPVTQDKLAAGDSAPLDSVVNTTLPSPLPPNPVVTPASQGSGSGATVLQSVVDTITDTDEEETTAGRSDTHIIQPVTDKASKDLNNRRVPTMASSASSKHTVGSSSSRSKDHFSFLDNMLSSEGATQHNKKTATVPTGATLTYSPRTTRSQVKGQPQLTRATSREKPKGRNTAMSDTSTQSKREGSPRSGDKPKTVSSSTTSSTKVSNPSVHQERRRARQEGQGKVGSSPPRGGPASKLSQHHNGPDSHHRPRLDPAKFQLGGRTRERMKVAATKEVTKAETGVEKGESECQENGDTGGGQDNKEAPRSTSPVF